MYYYVCYLKIYTSFYTYCIENVFFVGVSTPTKKTFV